MGLSELGEFGLIDRIRSRFPQPLPPDLGIGDDAALLTPQAGRQIVVSTDLLAEGVHFERRFGSARLLGRKTLSVNLSDLAAMGAFPRWAFLSLAVPAGFPLDELEAFLDGFAEQAAEHGVVLAGGDTCGSRSGLVLSVTIMGEQRPERLVTRSTARPGDDIWVSGTLGDAALGLQLLLADQVRQEEAAQYVVARHLDPSPRCRLGLALAEAGLASAMIDISDGLLGDLGHICRQSGCGAELQLAQLPRSDQFEGLAAAHGDYPWQLVLSGGEDYELCFTAPPVHAASIRETAKTAGIPVTVVGKVTGCSEIHPLLPDGTRYVPARAGFNHFQTP